MTTFISGFSLGLSLILAIGSQNAFVLKQGLKKEHVFIIVLTCAISDAILISLGVAGFGAVVEQYPSIEKIARYSGAAFLTIYAFFNFKSAFTVKHALNAHVEAKGSAFKILLMCLAFTWLNPHVYLDTVVLLGSISTQYQPDQLSFALGAISASFVFFFALGYGARFLAPFFKSESAWKFLELLVGTMMTLIALSLVL